MQTEQLLNASQVSVCLQVCEMHTSHFREDASVCGCVRLHFPSPLQVTVLRTGICQVSVRRWVLCFLPGACLCVSPSWSLTLFT